jgi:hypothetical protein
MWDYEYALGNKAVPHKLMIVTVTLVNLAVARGLSSRSTIGDNMIEFKLKVKLSITQITVLMCTVLKVLDPLI